MRVFTWEPLHRCQVNCANQRMRTRVLLHRAGSLPKQVVFFATICCFEIVYRNEILTQKQGWTRAGSGGIILTIREPQEGTAQDSAREKRRSAVLQTRPMFPLVFPWHFPVIYVFVAIGNETFLRMFLSDSKLCCALLKSLGTTFFEYLPSKNGVSIINSIECYPVKNLLI